MPSLRTVIRAIRADGPARTLSHLWSRARTRYNEWRLGIKTDEHIELSELGIDQPDGHYYAASRYEVVQQLIRRSRIDPARHVFLDVGVGMGRAAIVAAQYPFRRVLGVDISEELVGRARANVQAAMDKLHCKDIELFVADAATYEIPTEASVLYFWNPFSGEVLKAVLRNIRRSVEAAPRDLTMICVLPENSRFETELRKHTWLRLTDSVTLPGVGLGLIYHVGPSITPA